MCQYAIHNGDCLEVMRTMDDATFSAVVTDPPYGLSFMGKDWDRGVPGEAFWSEAMRVSKPGAMLLAFGGTRTYHRLACAIEDAGWIVRDCMSWLYGSGFPKSLNIGDAIDKQRYDRAQVLKVTAWIRAQRDAAGINNADIDRAFGFNGMAGHWTSSATQPAVPTLEQVPTLLDVLGSPDVPNEIADLLIELNSAKGQPGEAWFRREVVGERDVPIGHAFAGEIYQGANVGTKAVSVTAPATDDAKRWSGYGTALKPAWEPIIVAMKPTEGTFAQNALAHGVAGMNIDEGRIGEDVMNNAPAGNKPGGNSLNMSKHGMPQSASETVATGRWPANVALDETAAAMLGEPSRFFYTAKASKSDRGDGNDHPTVKPVDLMRWLIRLVTMPEGTRVLDPFVGSGTTGVACRLEGVDFDGIELNPEYADLARARIQGAHGPLFAEVSA